MENPAYQSLPSQDQSSVYLSPPEFPKRSRLTPIRVYRVLVLINRVLALICLFTLIGRISAYPQSGTTSAYPQSGTRRQIPTRDSIVFLLSDGQLKQVIEQIQPKPSEGLSAGAVALLGALIGAISAISSQLLVFLFGARKEKRNLKIELLSEERSQAVLLASLFGEFAWLKVSYEFWYRTSNLVKGDSAYQQFLLIRDRTSECKRLINTSLSGYFKTVTHYGTLTGKDAILQPALNQIKEFSVSKLDSDTFSSIDDIETLNQAAEAESDRLRQAYNAVNTYLDAVHSLMTK